MVQNMTFSSYNVTPHQLLKISKYLHIFQKHFISSKTVKSFKFRNKYKSVYKSFKIAINFLVDYFQDVTALQVSFTRKFSRLFPDIICNITPAAQYVL